MTSKKTVLTTFLGGLLLLGSWTINSCTKANEESLQNKTNKQPDCDTLNMQYTANVLPILTTNCYKCHSSSTYQNNSGLNLQDFNTLKSVVTNGSFLNSIKHTGSVTPMPIGGAQLSDCDINKIADWINRGAQNN